MSSSRSRSSQRSKRSSRRALASMLWRRICSAVAAQMPCARGLVLLRASLPAVHLRCRGTPLRSLCLLLRRCQPSRVLWTRCRPVPRRWWTSRRCLSLHMPMPTSATQQLHSPSESTGRASCGWRRRAAATPVKQSPAAQARRSSITRLQTVQHLMRIPHLLLLQPPAGRSRRKLLQPHCRLSSVQRKRRERTSSASCCGGRYWQS